TGAGDRNNVGRSPRLCDGRSPSPMPLRSEKPRTEHVALTLFHHQSSEERSVVMKVAFPAMRGQMGGRTYYSTLVKLNAIPMMFKFTDWVGAMPEDREQRVLNKKRIPDIASYITENEDSYLFSSITASYKCAVDFKPIGDDGLGMLSMNLQD